MANCREVVTAAQRAVVRGLAARCRELRQHGLEAAAAERRTFEEFLLDEPSKGCTWPTLYEDFVQAYAPDQRRARGVYYTPAAIVAAQVRLAADLLEQRLGCPTAFGDERVLVVDPAAGSGAYPQALLVNTLERAPAAPCTLAQRMRLFEPLAGAASLARAHGFAVEECDVLATPIDLSAADIVVCLGNPPYRRAKRMVGSMGLLGDFRLPEAGVHLKNTYNDYVYFWRWALRAVFEQRRGSGIVSFVSASSYLRGPGFGGMRQTLRRIFDDLWIVDLEGDRLAARQTDNVFAIRTPVAVAMGVRYAAPRSSQPANVHYVRLRGSRDAKLAVLDSLHHLSDVTWQSVASDWPAPFVYQPSSAYQGWPKLTELFPWQISGAQLKRTWPIGPTAEVLRERWARLLRLEGGERSSAFKETRDRDLDSGPPDLLEPDRRLAPLRSLKEGQACIEPVRYAYRSFDRHWVVPDARLGDFMRPALWRVAGPRQIFLTSMLTNVIGAGPAAVATALVPDLDHFRGSFGARAVIPLWCDAAAQVPNVAPLWLECLAERYGTGVDAQTLMAYCYALLGTRSYARRFEDELRTPGPRLPFPRDAAPFARAADLGLRLLWLHTFGERCVPPGVTPATVPVGVTRCIEAPVGGFPDGWSYDPGQQTLHLGNGVFGPLAPAVWEYSVSGLRVLPAWLRRRVRSKRGKSPLDEIAPHAWTPSLTGELLDVIWVLEATLALEPALDAVLAEIA